MTKSKREISSKDPRIEIACEIENMVMVGFSSAELAPSDEQGWNVVMLIGSDGKRYKVTVTRVNEKRGMSDV